MRGGTAAGAHPRPPRRSCVKSVTGGAPAAAASSAPPAPAAARRQRRARRRAHLRGGGRGMRGGREEGMPHRPVAWPRGSGERKALELVVGSRAPARTVGVRARRETWRRLAGGSGFETIPSLPRGGVDERTPTTRARGGGGLAANGINWLGGVAPTDSSGHFVGLCPVILWGGPLPHEYSTEDTVGAGPLPTFFAKDTPLPSDGGRRGTCGTREEGDSGGARDVVDMGGGGGGSATPGAARRARPRPPAAAVIAWTPPPEGWDCLAGSVRGGGGGGGVGGSGGGGGDSGCVCRAGDGGNGGAQSGRNPSPAPPSPPFARAHGGGGGSARGQIVAAAAMAPACQRRGRVTRRGV